MKITNVKLSMEGHYIEISFSESGNSDNLIGIGWKAKELKELINIKYKYDKLKNRYDKLKKIILDEKEVDEFIADQINNEGESKIE